MVSETGLEPALFRKQILNPNITGYSKINPHREEQTVKLIRI